MKRAIICEKRPNIISFIEQTLEIAGYQVIDTINDITLLQDKSDVHIFVDIEYGYETKQILKEIFKEKKVVPAISFYQVENNEVTGFWNEGILVNQPISVSNSIFIRSRGRLEKICKQDILYIESDKKYCTVNTLNKKYVLRTALKRLHEQLNHENFIRVHRSFLINKNHITTIDTQNQNVMIKDKEIPIGRFYQNNLFHQIKILQ